MVKRSREKKQQEETKKHQHMIMTENNLFKGYATKMFLITIENSPESFTLTVDGATDLPSRNFAQREEFHATIKLVQLLLVIISNTLCIKTFK